MAGTHRVQNGEGLGGVGQSWPWGRKVPYRKEMGSVKEETCVDTPCKRQ